MNNASAPSPPADSPHPQQDHRPEDDADDAPEQQEQPSQNGTADGQRQALSERAKEGLKKKLLFMNHLAQSLDTLIVAELCTLYYLDCSFFRLAIRWVPQYFFLSPKEEEFVFAIPKYHVGAIAGPNLLCILLHLFLSLPFAGEASRGYLHGGIIFDFIGQKAPTTRFSLLLLDILVLAAQCFLMTINMEKERLRKVVKPRRGETTDEGASTAEALATNQDHDAEERGVLREPPTTDDTNDIEMQPLREGSGQAGNETSTLLDHSTRQQPASSEDLVDVLRSGNAVLSNFHVPHAIRTAWNSRQTSLENPAAFALQNVAYNTTLARLTAERRARFLALQQRRA